MLSGITEEQVKRLVITSHYLYEQIGHPDDMEHAVMDYTDALEPFRKIIENMD